jgi:hypothetical protein
MFKLLVSKINEIKVIQVDESLLAVSHKKAKSNKPSPAKKDGENYSIDLGAGARVHTIKIHTLDKNETDTLFDVLYNERFCEITDKFIGKIKVYIDKVEISNSDKHIGKTIFNITATVQDIEKVPTVNATAQLKSTVTALEVEIATASTAFAETIKEVGTVDTIIDVATNTESFIDEAMSLMEDGLEAILDLQFIAFDFYNKIQSKVNRLKRIGETLKLVTSLPNAFLNLLLDTTDVQTGKNVKIFATKTSKATTIKSFDDDLSAFSQVEVEAIKKSLQSNQLLNLVTAVGEMKQALTKQYSSQQEFDTQISICIERLESTPLAYDKIVDAQQILKSYSNIRKLNQIVDYEVVKALPLASIVYGLYGNLDNYDAIRLINNFADNDNIVGNIKVFEDANTN